MALSDNLRKGMRRLAAGVCVISTQEGDSRFAMTASSVTSLSDSPASLLVCINREAAIQSVLKPGQLFAVSVLGSDQQDISNLCAQRDAADARFAVDCWAYVENPSIPYIESAQAVFFCDVAEESCFYGTHHIVIGKMTDILVSDTAVDPLVYADGAYQTLKPAS